MSRPHTHVLVTHPSCLDEPCGLSRNHLPHIISERTTTDRRAPHLDSRRASRTWGTSSHRTPRATPDRLTSTAAAPGKDWPACPHSSAPGPAASGPCRCRMRACEGRPGPEGRNWQVAGRYVAASPRALACSAAAPDTPSAATAPQYTQAAAAGQPRTTAAGRKPRRAWALRRPPVASPQETRAPKGGGSACDTRSVASPRGHASTAWREMSHQPAGCAVVESSREPLYRVSPIGKTGLPVRDSWISMPVMPIIAARPLLRSALSFHVLPRMSSSWPTALVEPSPSHTS